MAQTFGRPVTMIIAQPYEWCARITMPDGTQATLTIEQMTGGPAVLVVRSESEIAIRPVASNTIGLVLS